MSSTSLSMLPVLWKDRCLGVGFNRVSPVWRWGRNHLQNKVWLGSLDSWGLLMNRIIDKVWVPWKSQSTNPNHQFTMSWLLFLFPMDLALGFQSGVIIKSQQLRQKLQRHVSIFGHCKNYECHINHYASSNKTTKMCRWRWFQLFQCGKKRQKRLNKPKPPWAAMLVTLSSRTNLSVKSSASCDRKRSSDRLLRWCGAQGCAKCDTPSRPGCFWRIWIDI